MQPFGASPPRLPPPSARPQPTVTRSSLDGLADLEPKAIEDIVAGIELPLKSAAIASLWPSIWVEAGRGAPLSPAFEGIRIETLTRSGDVEALKRVLERVRTPTEPVLAVVVLRAQLLVGHREQACALAGEAIRNRATLPASFRRDAVLAAGICAMAGGNADAAKLTADLIRGEKLDVPFALAVLEGAGANGKAPPPLPSRVETLDYRLGEIAGVVWPKELVERAEPAVLAVIATAPTVDAGLRVVAAERAARLNLLSPDALAEQYRGIPHAPDELAHPLASRLSGAMKRSLLFQAAEAERAPDKKARFIRAVLDEARQADLGGVIARVLGTTVEALRPAPEIGWFAETAVEILVQAGRGGAALVWIDAQRGALDHWRILATLADERGQAGRSTGLDHLERLARDGRFEASRLHRLVTVLDALDIQVPLPIWEAASRTPQPTEGHLPPTGVLAELKSARDKGGARTVLRVAQAMGPASAADANLLTLGDTIRALKGVGLEQQARALGVEALIAAWPRAVAR